MKFGDYLRAAFARLYHSGVYADLRTDPRDAAIHLICEDLPPEKVAEILRIKGVTPEQAAVAIVNLTKTIEQTERDDFLEGAWNANAERAQARSALEIIANKA